MPHMTDTGFFKGWLGRFKLIRRYTLRKPEPGSEELGRLYEAYNVFTDNPALVLLPSERAPMEPQEEWRVRLRSQAEPPYVVLEVEKAPSTGRLSQLRGMLELLGTAVERLANNEEVRVHLANPPMGLLAFLWSLPERIWRWVRARRWRTVMAVVLMLLSLRLVVYLVEREIYVLDQDWSTPPVAQWQAVQQPAAKRAPMMINKPRTGRGVIAYPLPDKPFIDQAKAPCLPKEGEVEIHGGCWVALEKRPPCFDSQAEYKGKCYLPVSARSRMREPQSLQR
jgi:hypothetical protein